MIQSWMMGATRDKAVLVMERDELWAVVTTSGRLRRPDSQSSGRGSLGCDPSQDTPTGYLKRADVSGTCDPKRPMTRRIPLTPCSKIQRWRFRV